MNITDIVTAFHPEKAKYTFLSIAHGTFSRVDDILGHKTGLNQLKNTDVIPRTFLTITQ